MALLLEQQIFLFMVMGMIQLKPLMLSDAKSNPSTMI